MKLFLSLICFMFLIGCSYENNQLKILQPKSDRPDFLNLMSFKSGKKFYMSLQQLVPLSGDTYLMAPMPQLLLWKLAHISL